MPGDRLERSAFSSIPNVSKVDYRRAMSHIERSPGMVRWPDGSRHLAMVPSQAAFLDLPIPRARFELHCPRPVPQLVPLADSEECHRAYEREHGLIEAFCAFDTRANNLPGASDLALDTACYRVGGVSVAAAKVRFGLDYLLVWPEHTTVVVVEHKYGAGAGVRDISKRQPYLQYRYAQANYPGAQVRSLVAVTDGPLLDPRFGLGPGRRIAERIDWRLYELEYPTGDLADCRITRCARATLAHLPGEGEAGPARGGAVPSSVG